jgi:uncharacterized protein (DUF433 family)
MPESLDDPKFPRITYRRGAAGEPTAVLRGTGLRVQTLVVAARHWGMKAEQVAAEYCLSEAQVQEALAFAEVHRAEMDASLEAELALDPAPA